MCTSSLFRLSFILLSLVFLPSILNAAATATITGYVTDAVSGEPLPGANIYIAGTGLGSSSDHNGKYTLDGVPEGTHNLRVTYIGYASAETMIEVESSGDFQVNFKLKSLIIEGQPIDVTAQPEGQLKAINQQLTSKAIVNVVSSARIEELPDANAAESVARLPGVSVLREGGEGNKIVIRGLSPKYNIITINGVRMASTDYDDRSVDLSMIAPNMLESIEVMKAITPDQDADVLGGSLDFRMKEAPAHHKSGISYDVISQGGYNGLKNSYTDYNYAGTVSTRIFDNRLGLLGQLSAERRNRSSNELGASYYLDAPEMAINNPTYLSGLDLFDRYRDKKRIGGTLIADYRFSSGKISSTNFFSMSETDIEKRSESYYITSDEHDYRNGDSRNELNVVTNILNYEQSVHDVSVEVMLAHSFSENKSPDNFSTTFYKVPAGLSQVDPKINPGKIPSYAEIDPLTSYLSWIGESDQQSRERELTASLDFERLFNHSRNISSRWKTGCKYRYKDRSYNIDEAGVYVHLGSAQDTREDILNAFSWMRKTVPDASMNLPLALFIDPDYTFDPFLDGEYKLGPPVDINLMHAVHEVARESGIINKSYNRDDVTSNTHDYSGTDDLFAGYILSEARFGQGITVIPGIRYEQLVTSYTGARGNSAYSGSQYHYSHFDTTLTRTHDFWLPMIHLRYKPVRWFDIRFAYTNTLTYPDYRAIIPRIDITLDRVYWNNPDLKPAQSENFDLYFSFYSNELGLFTVGGFLKKIGDMIFRIDGQRIIDAGHYDGIDNIEEGKYLTTRINNPYRVNLNGLEIDWQTHFWYLPGLLKGLVLNANYTHIFSEARYPRSYFHVTHLYEGPPWCIKANVDTFYTNRLIEQPDDIINLSLGYDFKGFSIRLSMLYQENVFKGDNFWPELRSITDDYLRWDLSAKQILPWYGLQIFGNINNIFGERDTNVIQGSLFPVAEQHYGTTADLGLRLRL